MKRFVLFFALLIAASSAWAEDAATQYAQIYEEIREADRLHDRGQQKQALAKYLQAEGALKALQLLHPSWQKKVIDYRLQYLAAKIQPLQSTVTAASAASPASTPSPPVVAAAPPSNAQPSTNVPVAVLNGLENELARLTAQTALLLEKLKEAEAAARALAAVKASEVPASPVATQPAPVPASSPEPPTQNAEEEAMKARLAAKAKAHAEELARRPMATNAPAESKTQPEPLLPKPADQPVQPRSAVVEPSRFGTSSQAKKFRPSASPGREVSPIQRLSLRIAEASKRTPKPVGSIPVQNQPTLTRRVLPTRGQPLLFTRTVHQKELPVGSRKQPPSIQKSSTTPPLQPLKPPERSRDLRTFHPAPVDRSGLAPVSAPPPSLTAKVDLEATSLDPPLASVSATLAPTYSPRPPPAPPPVSIVAAQIVNTLMPVRLPFLSFDTTKAGRSPSAWTHQAALKNRKDPPAHFPKQFPTVSTALRRTGQTSAPLYPRLVQSG